MQRIGKAVGNMHAVLFMPAVRKICCDYIKNWRPRRFIFCVGY